MLNVAPDVDGGAFPAKSVVHEEFDVTATVFREGHDAVNATVVLTDPDGAETHVPMTLLSAGLDHWSATVSADRTGMWSYRVEGWSDPYATWDHDATIKVEADVDTDLMLEEGARVLERALAEVPRTPEQAVPLHDAVTALRDADRPAEARLRAGTSPEVRAEMHTRPLRDFVTSSRPHAWLVERERALYGAWYEIFPRSEGATRDPETGLWTSGTFDTAQKRLPAIADMGFDVVYLTPVHPIGRVNRKGPNNTLDAGEHDPGSPYAIGSAEGGHDAIHPDLGDFDSFDRFVAEAERLGLEVALDLALQAAPDHPWATTHPELFTTRADGSIAYAENPPKKYQDIYPLNFDNAPEVAYAEVRRVVQVWIDHGVKIFRVDNPHTKPVEFWQWLIADVADVAPGGHLAGRGLHAPGDDAHARPRSASSSPTPTTRGATRSGRSRSTSRSSPARRRRTCARRSGPRRTTSSPPTCSTAARPPGSCAPRWPRRWCRPTASTPATSWSSTSPGPASRSRSTTRSTSTRTARWSDYEPGGPKEGQSLAPYLTQINQIRAAHPALHWLRNIAFHHVEDENVMAFSKRRRVDGRDDVVIVVANLDPHATRETWVHLDMPALGLGYQDTFVAHDLITGQSWQWGEHAFVRLGPDSEPVHVIQMRRF